MNDALIFPSVRLLPSWPLMLWGVLILLFIYAGLGMGQLGHRSKSMKNSISCDWEELIMLASVF